MHTDPCDKRQCLQCISEREAGGFGLVDTIAKAKSVRSIVTEELSSNYTDCQEHQRRIGSVGREKNALLTKNAKQSADSQRQLYRATKSTGLQHSVAERGCLSFVAEAAYCELKQ